MATVQMVRRGFDLSGDLTALPGGAMAQTVFQFGNLLVFSILVGLGLFLRRSRETHKRLLALAVLQTLLAAPVAHLVGHFALPVVLLPLWGLLVLAAFVVHDRRVGGRAPGGVAERITETAGRILREAHDYSPDVHHSAVACH